MDQFLSLLRLNKDLEDLGISAKVSYINHEVELLERLPIKRISSYTIDFSKDEDLNLFKLSSQYGKNTRILLRIKK